MVLEFFEVSCAQNACNPSGSWPHRLLMDSPDPGNCLCSRPLMKSLIARLPTYQLPPAWTDCLFHCNPVHLSLPLLVCSVLGSWPSLFLKDGPRLCQHPEYKLTLFPVTPPLRMLDLCGSQLSSRRITKLSLEAAPYTFATRPTSPKMLDQN